MNVYLPQCAYVQTYGCPGGPAGDEYAAPVEYRCQNSGTELVLDKAGVKRGMLEDWCRHWICKYHCQPGFLEEFDEILTDSELPHEVEVRIKSDVALIKLREALDSGAIKSGPGWQAEAARR